MIREKGAVSPAAEETSSEFLKKMMEANQTAIPTTAAAPASKGPKIEVLSGAAAKPKALEAETEPEYKIVHQGTFKYENFTNERIHLESSRPESLSVKICLPKIVSFHLVSFEYNHLFRTLFLKWILTSTQRISNSSQKESIHWMSSYPLKSTMRRGRQSLIRTRRSSIWSCLLFNHLRL